MSPIRAQPAALAAVAVLALCAALRTLDGGFLSDDLLLDFFTDRDPQVLRPDWSRVAADFARPWLDLPGALYRPLVSASFAFDLGRGGGEAGPFHQTNVALHVLVAVFAAALVARTLDPDLHPRHRAVATLGGGAIVALHPVAIEPIAWLAARNSSLEIAAHALAALAFASFCRTAKVSRLLVCALAALVALATKESAVVLPVSLLVVDLLVRRGLDWRSRLRVHAALLPLWLGYAALRVSLFHGLAPASATTGGAWLDAAGSKFAALFAPGAEDSVWLGAVALVGWLGAAVVLLRCSRSRLLLLAAWLLAHLSPSAPLAVGNGLSGTRLVYGALLPLALLMAHALARRPRLVLAPCVLMLVAFAWQGQLLVDRYRAGWGELAIVASDLASHAGEASGATPLVVTAVPPTRTSLPPFNHNGWFTLGARPLQRNPLPVVSAGYVTAPTPHAETLLRDGSPLRALLEHGCTLLAWDQGAQRFLARRRASAPAEPPSLERDGGSRHGFRFASAVSPDALEQLTLRVRGPLRGGRVSWRTAIAELPPELAGLAFGPGREDGPERVITLDLSSSIGLPSLATFGIGVDGFDFEFDGEVELVELLAARRVPELLLPQRFAGTGLDAASFEAGLRSPAAPEPGGSTVAMRLVLQTAMGAVVVPCRPAEAVVFPAAAREALSVLVAACRERGVWYWFDARTAAGEPGFGRSAVDRVVLTR
ncbi:MAG: hypothetical protein IT457_14675 [Planctomycetes bacterium]|nr:hypothetical protein [Planctomycetota bacterium]